MSLSIEIVEEVSSRASKKLSELSSVEKVIELKTEFVGKKGELSQLMVMLKDLTPEQKKEVGGFLNKSKKELEEKIESRISELKEFEEVRQLEKEWIDPTLKVDAPFLSRESGKLHPITQVQYELERIFESLGFTVVDGPELESEYYNFTALNIPDTHPARDMQDTLWTKAGDLLRTHTSSIQVRNLKRMRGEELKTPLRLVAPGRCFRAERLDATHESTFYQMEGIMIDKEVNVGHLIYFMKTILRSIFGTEQKIRLRPGYFPFVEPGFELDIWFNDRWLELLPCGLVHPKVLEHGGIDPQKWQGFAFGLGLSRLVMSRFKVNDIRHFQAGDLRFLKQF